MIPVENILFETGFHRKYNHLLTLQVGYGLFAPPNCPGKRKESGKASRIGPGSPRLIVCVNNASGPSFRHVGMLYLSAITVAELRAGVALMPVGKRRISLHENLEKRLLPMRGILPSDPEPTARPVHALLQKICSSCCESSSSSYWLHSVML